jgi:dCTP deaminase
MTHEQLFDSFERLSDFDDTRPDWVKELHGTLSDRDIARLILTGEIKIIPEPDLEKLLDSCKIDLHLGSEFKRYDYTKVVGIDSKTNQPQYAEINEFRNPGELIIIPPHELIIAKTKEWFELPNYIMARLEGKSKVARMPLLIEAAPIFDAGWKGNGVMEIVNPGRVPQHLIEGQKICALNFHILSTPAIKSRDKGFGTYNDQNSLEGPRALHD